MEYIFGTDRGKENLKTVGDTHTDLAGICIIQRQYPDCTITDRFKVDKKSKAKEGSDGKCYDFYDISEHSRQVDKTPETNAKIDELSTVIDDILVELLSTEVESDV